MQGFPKNQKQLLVLTKTHKILQVLLRKQIKFRRIVLILGMIFSKTMLSAVYVYVLYLTLPLCFSCSFLSLSIFSLYLTYSLYPHLKL